MAKAKKHKSTIDPVLKLIKEHKQANVDFYRALKTVPGTCSPDPKKEAKYADREEKARRKLIATSPTTMSGLLQLFAYIEGVSNGQQSPNGKPDITFEVAEELMRVISGALVYLRGQFSGEQIGRAA